MSLAPGSRLGSYEISSKLGEGGMGVVYRARDSRLGREVAVKVLPEALAADPERLARFEREARVLASLNHPNIATIHGLEETAGVRALVMELVEGETLDERLRRGPFALDEALAVAVQVAEALEAAHDKGVVHRDLKPANVKLTEEGKVNVLDFGLAKALAGDSGLTSASGSTGDKSPTLTVAATQAGTILGTAGYMAPEQARGRPVDKRADIWAFGTMLYEMLAGRRLFEGETVSDTLAAVLRQEVDWSRLPAGTQPALRTLLRRCLERDPRNRLHDIADARIVLAELIQGAPQEAVAGTAAAPARFPRWLVALATLLGVSTLALAILQLSGRGGSGRAPAQIATTSPSAFRQLTILPGGEHQPALSPDGTSFAFVRQVGRQSDIFVQRVDGRNPVNLTAQCAADDGAPAFSPDGGRIAYRSECSGGGIFVMGATGESARKLTEFGFDPAWSPDGEELAVVTERLAMPWGRVSRSELWAIDVATGERRRVSERDSMQPSWSPDGKRIAVWGMRGETSDRDVWTVAADGSQSTAPVPLVEGPALDWNPIWSGDGSAVLFASSRGGTFNLWRIDVDRASGAARGEPVPMTVPSGWAGWVSASRDGRRMIFVDRNSRGTLYRAPLDPGTATLAGAPAAVPLGSLETDGVTGLSPDGGTVAVATAGLPQHLYLVRPDGSSLRQLTEGPHRDRQPTFSPDGAWIVFQTDRFGADLGLIRPDGSGLRAIETGKETAWYPRWSPDGRFLAISSYDGPQRIEDPMAARSPIAPLPAPPGGRAFWPISWSADGRRIAGDLLEETRPCGAAVLEVASGEYTEVLPSDGFVNPQFLPGGKHLIGTLGTALVSIDLATRTTRALIEAAPGHNLLSPTVSSNGRWLLWSDVSDESDIWIAESDPGP